MMKLRKIDCEEQEIPRVSRTLTGTIFELIALALNIALWIAGALLAKMGKIELKDMLVAASASTVVSASLLISAYFPKYIDLPVRMKNIYQWKMAITMTRVSAIEVPLFIGVPLLLSTPEWVLFVGVGVTVLIELLFTLRIYQLGKL